MSSNQSHCKRGHEFTEENTWFNNQGSRVCRTCRALRTAEYRLRNPGEKKGHRNIHKTHCPKGHEYDEDNTYISRNKRHCKKCALVNHETRRFKKYGVTKEWYEEATSTQENRCGICNREFVNTPHIDHNHATGEVRGLLCYSCNGAIGQFQEDITVLKNAIAYLEKFSKTTPAE